MNWRQDLINRRPHSPPPGTARVGVREAVLRTKSPPADEALIVDVRCQVRPAQQVEDKLLSLLKSVFVPLSQVRMSPLNDGRGRRGHC